MKNIHAEKTEYQAVIHTAPSLFRRSCRVMAGFLRDNGLDPDKGMTLLIGEELPEQAEEFLPTGRAVFLKADCGAAEEVLTATESLCGSQLVLFAPDPLCEELAVRLSVRLGGTSVTDALSARVEEGIARVERRIYGGHLTGTFRLSKGPFFISLNKGLDEADPVSGKVEETVTADTDGQKTCYDREITQVPSGSDLEDAKTVVIGGRGLGNKEGAQALAEIASRMGAASGGTRPVIMNAWMERDKLTGVSGAMIHPELCIVCGGSGSPAFYEGIRRSKTIIAVNTDERAPIMKKADACVCADWREVMEALAEIVTQ